MWVHLKGLRSICCSTNLALPPYYRFPLEIIFSEGNDILLVCAKLPEMALNAPFEGLTSATHEISFYCHALGHCLSTKKKDLDRN